MVDKNRSFDSWRLFGLENAIVYKICFAFTASDITAPKLEFFFNSILLPHYSMFYNLLTKERNPNKGCHSRFLAGIGCYSGGHFTGAAAAILYCSKSSQGPSLGCLASCGGPENHELSEKDMNFQAVVWFAEAVWALKCNSMQDLFCSYCFWYYSAYVRAVFLVGSNFEGELKQSYHHTKEQYVFSIIKC